MLKSVFEVLLIVALESHFHVGRNKIALSVNQGYLSCPSTA